MNIENWSHKSIGEMMLSIFGVCSLVFSFFWRWLDKHMKYIRIKLNGYVIEKKRE